MNIYEKITKARILFAQQQVKKSGKNAFAGYSYYELSDILPHINQLARELKFFCAATFTVEMATLRITDAEKPESFLEWSLPMSSASLKGCHEVQNLGATQTYLKRYLYQNAFEIVEGDALDATMGKPERAKFSPKKEEPKVSKSETAKKGADAFLDAVLEKKIVDAQTVEELGAIFGSLTPEQQDLYRAVFSGKRKEIEVQTKGDER